MALNGSLKSPRYTSPIGKRDNNPHRYNNAAEGYGQSDTSNGASWQRIEPLFPNTTLEVVLGIEVTIRPSCERVKKPSYAYLHV